MLVPEMMTDHDKHLHEAETAIPVTEMQQTSEGETAEPEHRLTVPVNEMQRPGD